MPLGRGAARAGRRPGAIRLSAFASRCRAIHGWYGLDGIHYIAYLCETNIYVDIGGVLVDITPVDGMVAPLPVGEGGYSDGLLQRGVHLRRDGGRSPRDPSTFR